MSKKANTVTGEAVTLDIDNFFADMKEEEKEEYNFTVKKMSSGLIRFGSVAHEDPSKVEIGIQTAEVERQSSLVYDPNQLVNLERGGSKKATNKTVGLEEEEEELEEGEEENEEEEVKEKSDKQSASKSETGKGNEGEKGYFSNREGAGYYKRRYESNLPLNFDYDKMNRYEGYSASRLDMYSNQDDYLARRR